MIVRARIRFFGQLLATGVLPAAAVVACSSVDDVEDVDGSEAAQTAEAPAPADEKLPGGSPCVEDRQCATKTCFIAPGKTCDEVTPSATRKGTCCVDPGGRATAGDPRSCCGAEANADGVCCLGSGKWAGLDKAQWKGPAPAKVCCSGSADNGYCSNSHKNGIPEGRYCFLDGCVAGSQCHNLCPETSRAGGLCCAGRGKPAPAKDPRYCCSRTAANGVCN
jgi:hypothetical protein